ncbi:CDK-activating kinase assembly factor MAT1 [Dictyostelium discoideum AX4]|uniref:CDK-activating kinase assembly factor MAT1 n=1 Tax=Dictyostelium discoideum TaxID=44689 RepID=Q54I13_DICDI|nr:CDK-activating kinase assembly factor MAT1 [Dictyostelium discoideum AX4]EAL62889.2 CDK-activating kinase assembly factor MAT1 [Dictyostelium discoideum AX4]|eukprot:XP_636392.2 CDK-activating kinase assembly factor MAT1 [Dictyostelium discoideum AX4]
MNIYDDDQCIKCNSGLYLNPNMRLLTSPCGHKYCESCVQLAYMKDSVIQCLGCTAQIRKQSFMNQRYDDTGLEKENSIRKKYLKEFNKTRKDFNSLVEYNNFLEMVEDLIFDAIEGGDLATASELKLKEYQKANQASIATNKKAKEEEDTLIASRIADEQRLIAEKRNKFLAEDQKEQNSKKLESQKAMDDLAKGKISAKELKEIDKKKAAASAAKLAAAAAAASMVNEPLPPIHETDNKQSFTYQPQNKQQQQQQQQGPTNQQLQQQQQVLLQMQFNEPQPLGEFKYDEMALKNLIPTPQQSDVAGFKQKYIRQRAFEEAFQYL